MFRDVRDEFFVTDKTDKFKKIPKNYRRPWEIFHEDTSIMRLVTALQR